MTRLLGGFSLLVWGYFIALQMMLLFLFLVSARTLSRERRVERFGRVEDMLTSDLAPPVSIVVPAHNEGVLIVEAVRTMAMVAYPRFEIVVANDGSSDDTLEKLIHAFELYPVPYPIRTVIDTAPIRAVYKSRLPIPLTVIDKDNGGRADALNAAINVARYPYILATDADVYVDGKALAHAMRLVAEDRERTVGVGGNIRPINGCHVSLGHIVEPKVPSSLVERYQLLEYVRAFVASRPGWSSMNCLPLLSGAFGVWRRDIVAEVGGFTSGHYGEDLDITMRIHRHMRSRGLPYRIVYSPSAVVWTEVPPNLRVLRRQRIRWHWGLMQAMRDFRSSVFNPKHGLLGLLAWPAMVIFEFLAPVVEFVGWIVVPLSVVAGVVSLQTVAIYFLIALLAGTITSLLALTLDERFGYFNDPRESLKLLTITFVENLGIRQLTVWWRIQAMLTGETRRSWGNMERQGGRTLGRPAA